MRVLSLFVLSNGGIIWASFGGITDAMNFCNSFLFRESVFHGPISGSSKVFFNRLNFAVSKARSNILEIEMIKSGRKKSLTDS